MLVTLLAAHAYFVMLAKSAFRHTQAMRYVSLLMELKFAYSLFPVTYPGTGSLLKPSKCCFTPGKGVRVSPGELEGVSVAVVVVLEGVLVKVQGALGGVGLKLIVN